MIKFKFLSVILSFAILVSLNSCGIYKRADVKDVPVNVDDRTRKNIQEGRGIRFGKGATRGGDFDFASSNPKRLAPSIKFFSISNELCRPSRPTTTLCPSFLFITEPKMLPMA